LASCFTEDTISDRGTNREKIADHVGGESEEPEEGKTLFHGGVFSAFADRDYAVLWSGAFISNIGTWIQSAALLWLIKEVFESNSLVGAVNMANFLPVLFIVPFIGFFADRYNRRTIILIGQVVMMLGALALGIAASFHSDSKAVILLTVTVIGIAFAFNFPAWQAILPDLVPQRDLMNAIAMSSAQWNLARFVGPAIAALILAVSSATLAFYVNAISFLFVIGALLMVHPTRSAVPPPTQSILQDILAGYKYVWHRRWMVNLVVAFAFISFFGFSFLVLIPAMAKDVLGKGAVAYGVMLSLVGLGAVVGAPLVTHLGRRYPERVIIKASMLGFGLFLLAFALIKVFWILCIIMVGLGLTFLMISTVSNSVLQGCSDRVMRGRVVSLYIITFVGVMALGGQFMGYLADARSTPFALALGAMVCLATAAVLIAFPSLIRQAATPKGGVGPFEPALEGVGAAEVPQEPEDRYFCEF
jgi:MFS family permease